MASNPKEYSREVREKVMEIEQGWTGLREKARKNRHQLYAHKEYEDELIKALDPQITTRIPYASRRPDHAARQIEGILKASHSFHVEPPPGKGEASPATKRADREELCFAHLW